MGNVFPGGEVCTKKALKEISMNLTYRPLKGFLSVIPKAININVKSRLMLLGI